jgi:hypothetical protein
MPVTLSKREKPEGDAAQPDVRSRAKRHYEKPRLVDYGSVSKLTQTGGITTQDTGSMKRVCL